MNDTAKPSLQYQECVHCTARNAMFFGDLCSFHSPQTWAQQTLSLRTQRSTDNIRILVQGTQFYSLCLLCNVDAKKQMRQLAKLWTMVDKWFVREWHSPRASDLSVRLKSSKLKKQTGCKQKSHFSLSFSLLFFCFRFLTFVLLVREAAPDTLRPTYRPLTFAIGQEVFRFRFGRQVENVVLRRWKKVTINHLPIHCHSNDVVRRSKASSYRSWHVFNVFFSLDLFEREFWIRWRVDPGELCTTISIGHRLL